MGNFCHYAKTKSLYVYMQERQQLGGTELVDQYLG